MGRKKKKKKSNIASTLTKIKYDLKTALLYFNKGDFNNAEIILGELLKKKSVSSKVFYYYGILKFNKTEYEIALESFLKAETLLGDVYEITYNCGNCYHKLYHLEEAKKYYIKTLKIKPNFYPALNNLGTVYKELNEFDKAIECYQKAIFFNKDYVDSYYNLGNIYKLMGNFKKALRLYNKVLTYEDFNDAVSNNIAIILVSIGDVFEGIIAYRKAIAINPNNSQYYSNMLLAMHYTNSYTNEQLYEAHLKWNDLYSSDFIYDNYKNSCVFPRKLKIGFVSADFCRHSCAYFLHPLIKNLDRENFEIYVYSYNQYPDEITEVFKNYCNNWVDAYKYDDDKVSKIINEQQIDILIDLSGHAGISKLSVFSYKPAPVSITWLGYPDTTGLSTIDYRIVDKITDPEDSSKYNSEKLLYLSGGFLCYKPFEKFPEIRKKSEDEFIFASFNNISKINDYVIETWAEILKRVSNSKMLIKSSVLANDLASDRLFAKFSSLGIENERIIIVKRTKLYNNHLSMYNNACLSLDTFPYNGTTTTFESLMMGTVVITLKGRRHCSRVGASIMNNIGHPYLVAETISDYIDKAVYYANNKEELDKINNVIRADLLNSSLCDEKRFVREFEEKLVTAFKNWIENEKNKGN